MYETTYHRATSVADAAAKIAGSEDGKILSGGMTLLPTMKQRLAAPSDLVDVTHVADLKGIAETGGALRIGAATTHAEVAGSQSVRRLAPGLAELAGHIGDPHVRHRGTIGGSIANNDPAADYPSAMLALGATIVTDKRRLAAEEFFTGLFETALEEGEIVTAVEIPACAACAYAKYPNPASRYAMAGVFVARTDGGVRVAVTGAGSNGVFRHEGLEQALSQSFTPEAAASVTTDADELISDIHGSADYRANLITVMAKRAVTKLAG
ncbi:FAD binding domain-containing protein [Stappia indica]|uniref:FAD binding domain-containing protein n=1 Tax=Stappia indica TaxID=538381 RepID=UPI00082C3B72|nr:xanthine dehydrogenase family protein subunit M [Stappia indica]